MKIIKSPSKFLLDKLISVDPNDNFLGPIDKWHAHSNTYLSSPSSLPHRAFSIFLFNSKNKLLLQQRSIHKRTFPLCWTNTCCSHPNIIVRDDKEQQEPIRESLARALERELKMKLKSQFFFMGKVLYKGLGKEVKGNDGEGFGEYEVDYVYLNKLPNENVEFKEVQSEVNATRWIERGQLEGFMRNVKGDGGYFSPWFDKMVENGLLEQWWDMVEKGVIKNGDEKASVIDYR